MIIRSTPWFQTWKGLLVIVGIAFVIIAAIVASVVVSIVLTRNPTSKRNIQSIFYSKITISIFILLVQVNTTTTTVGPIINSAYWPFDNDATDSFGTYNGTLTNGAVLSNSTYFGYGSNLMLNSTVNQSVLVASPYFNLSSASFTVEAWIYGRTFTGDNAVFAQCQCSSCQDQCLFLIIRNARMYMGFTLDDVVGITSLSTTTWTHVAFVYDTSTRTQSLYLQGVLDNSRTASNHYQGVSGSIVIGSSHLSASSFNGYIDNVKLTTRAKSASEVLDAASIVVYYSFDGGSLAQDMGPNQMNGTAYNSALVTGRVGQGLAFSGSLSYLAIYGFFQLGQSNRAFSFALWIYPYSVAGGTLVRKVVTAPSTGWCQNMMGLTVSGQITFYTNGGSAQITGPFISTMRWTHIIYTYSSTNGQTMYINGVQYARTGAITFSSSGSIDTLMLGYDYSSCSPYPNAGGYFLGAIDEFYVYRRELTASDAQTLANP